MPDPLAYFLTWTTSGTWLHGDERGSKDHTRTAIGERELPPDEGLNRYRRFQLGDKVFLLDSPAKRAAVRDAIERTCALRDWRISAVNVRTNHVHLVVSADQKPEEVMTSLKAWATRALVAGGLVDRGERVWTRHGSTRYLWSEADVIAAGTYVVEGQGADLD
ncbi:MAG: transposase [Dehalococcoidia bacterium]|jgi:REP element-mobilizing transposase RayT